MQKSKYIEHPGRISDINGEKIKVSFISESACASCHAKGICGPMDQSERSIEIESRGEDYYVNEPVNVLITESLGLKALMVGYILPFILVVVILAGLLSVTDNEGLSGLTALLSLIPYYLVVYFFRNKLEKIFVFSIQKLG